MNLKDRIMPQKKIIFTCIYFSIFLLNSCGGGGNKSSPITNSSTSNSSTSNSSTSNSSNDDSLPVTYTTKDILCDINEVIFNNDESINTNSSYTWSCNASNRLLSGNGIPDHEVGTFPNINNPNSISTQVINKTFTNNPIIINESGSNSEPWASAYALNSVKFDPATAGRCNNDGVCDLAMGSGSWNIEALGHDSFDFGDDMNHAHVQPTGAYHYHGIPELYLKKLDKGEAMTLVGWAPDGFPVYARYGYSEADNANSNIKIITPSWRLKNSSDPGRPQTNVNTGDSIPMGAFTQDFEYIEGLGDLDKCNGRSGVTPEFPSGIYYYMVTDAFPFFSRCFKGNF